MPRISLEFAGWIHDLPIRTAEDQDGEEVDVSNMHVEELVKKLNDRELTLDIVACIRDSADTECELSNFKVAD